MDENETARSLLLDYKQTFESEYGKRVLADLEKSVSFYDFGLLPKGSDNHTDVFQVVFSAGQRYTVARIKHQLNTDPDEVKGIQNEQQV